MKDIFKWIMVFCVVLPASCINSYAQQQKKVVLFLYDPATKDFSLYKPRKKDSAVFRSKHMVVVPRKGKFSVALKGFDHLKYVGKIESVKPVNFKTGMPASLTALVGTADPFQPTGFAMPPTTIQPSDLSKQIKAIERDVITLSKLKDSYNLKMDSFKILSEQNKWDYDDFSRSQDEFVNAANAPFSRKDGLIDFEENPFSTKHAYKWIPKTTTKLSTVQLEGLVALQVDRIKELTRQIDALKAITDQYTVLINHADIIVGQLNIIDKLTAFAKSLEKTSVDEAMSLLQRKNAMVGDLDAIAALFSIPDIGKSSPTAFNKALKKAIDKLHGELSSNQALLRLELQGNIVTNQNFQSALSQIIIRYDYYINESDNFKKLVANIMHWANPSGGYVSTETQNTKIADVIRIKFSVSSTTNKTDTITKIVNVSTKNGIDVDFSTGLVYNTIYKQGYNIRFKFTDPANPTTAERYIDKEDTWKGDVAISAFVNFSFRTRIGMIPLRTGISPGLGLSVVDAGGRYFAGWHLYFGQQGMIGIVGGVAFGKTIRLSSSVSENGIDPTEDRVAYNGTGLGSVPTYDQFVSGGFVGLVWNLSRK